MTASLVFFGFTGLGDVTRHPEYNEWHQLDHLPENMLLPGVLWGDRWVRSPDCESTTQRHGSPQPDYDYALMYWFMEPETASVDAWRALAARSIQWGRRPELGWIRRSPLGFFRPVKGYVHPRVLVSADALPMRPHRGVHVSLTRVEQPESPAAVEEFAWDDRTVMPQLLERPGVAGGWIFSFAAPPGGFGAIASTDDPAPGQVRLRLLFLDGEPNEVDTAVDRPTGSVQEPLFASSFRTISPWQWNWFEKDS
jgi:hypothetical protein